MFLKLSKQRINNVRMKLKLGRGAGRNDASDPRANRSMEQFFVRRIYKPNSHHVAQKPKSR